MDSFSKRTQLPSDVQENIIHNIQRIFPNTVDKELIRAVLIKEDWDLEKSLQFLQNTLASFNKGNKNAGNPNKKNKSANKSNQSENKPKTVKQQTKVEKVAVSQKQSENKPKVIKQQTKAEKVVVSQKGSENKPKTVKKQTKAEKVVANQKATTDLFKKGPTPTQKSKAENILQGDWVVVKNPSTPTGAGAVSKDESKSMSKESKIVRKKQIMQNYDIIKHFGESITRISAYIKEEIKVMVLLRGCPGSGKTTYANQLLSKVGAKYPECHIFSTDNFFVLPNGGYNFSYDKLQEAHEWNQKLVQQAALEGRSPIFIDNTNTRLWEMREYAMIAIKYGYVLETLEPPTPWFFNEDILCRKTLHATPRETIRKMLDRYEANLSGEDVIRNLQLVYSPNMMPPQVAVAGINTPMSKNQRKMLNINQSNQTVVPDKIKERKAKLKKVKESSKTKEGSVMAPCSEFYKQSHLINSGFYETASGSLNIGSQSSNPLPPNFSGMFSKNNVFPCDSQNENAGPQSIPPITSARNALFASLQRFMEHNTDASNNIKTCDNTTHIDYVNPNITDSIKETSKTEDTEVEKQRESSPFVMPNSVSPCEDDSQDDTSDFFESDVEPEEMTSSNNTQASEDSEEETENEATNYEEYKNNLEYVLVSSDYEVTFQKHHTEMEGIKTLVAFKETISNSFAECSQKFEDYLIEHIQHLDLQNEETCHPENENDFSEEVVSSASMSTQAANPQGIVSFTQYNKEVSFNGEEVVKQNIPEHIAVPSFVSSEICEGRDFKVGTTNNIHGGNAQETYTANPVSYSLTRHISSENDTLTTKVDQAESSQDIQLSHDVKTVHDQPGTPATEQSTSKTPIDTLQFLFPNISRDKLIEIFGTSLKDIDWAVCLLLDSGQEMITPENVRKVFNAAVTTQDDSQIKPEEKDLLHMSSTKTDNVSSDNEIKSIPKNYGLSITANKQFEVKNKSPLYQETGQSFSAFLQGNESIPCSSAAGHSLASNFSQVSSVLKNNNITLNKDLSNEYSKNHHTFGAVPKNNTCIGDWDYSKEIPIPLPVDSPKLQRDYMTRNINKTSISTNTNYADFETLRIINCNANYNLQNPPKVLIGNPSFKSISSPNPVFSSTFMLEKGTMTTNIETNQIEKFDSGVDRLALMFPQVSRENLEELFEKCQRDIDWTVGLLLDSGQVMSELYASLEPLESSVSEEPQLSKNVEDNPVIEQNDNKKGRKPRRRKRLNQPKTDNETYEDLQKQFQNNFVLNDDCYTSERMKNYFKNKHPNKTSPPEKEETLNTAEEDEDDGSTTDNTTDNVEEEIVFMLDSDFILQLQARFGGLLRPNMLAEKNVVSLPLSLARQLHSYVMDSVQQHIQEENIFTDEDEEYARHLQEEENRALGAPSLLQIMDEEVALRKIQKEPNSGRSMASALSKQLLLERFPRMDPATLASILEDTNHSLHQATFVLSSAGHTQVDTCSDQAASSLDKDEEEEEEEKTTLSREEAIKQADAYGDVASQLYELRKDCLKKSQKAYREGNHSVALYYSDMARWYMERIEKSNSMAAKAILSGYEGWTTLDLHFLQVSEALNVLDLFVDEVIRDLQKSNNRQAVVYVITGRGIHSAGGRPRLKPAVQSRLIKRDLKFSVKNPGMLRVVIPRTALTSYKQQIEACA